MIGILFHQAIAVLAAILYAVFFNLIGVEGDLWLGILYGYFRSGGGSRPAS